MMAISFNEAYLGNSNFGPATKRHGKMCLFNVIFGMSGINYSIFFIMDFCLSLLYLGKDNGPTELASLGMTTGACKLLKTLIMPYFPRWLGNDIIRVSKFTSGQSIF